jgi:valyl-tRNA synthetase
MLDLSKEDFEQQSFPTQWFEARLTEATKEIEKLYNEFKLSEALKTTYSLIWDDFCSWYLEWIKPAYGQGIWNHFYEETLYFFERLLQLLHPFMPFVTEEIYHQLRKREEGDDLAIRQNKEQHFNFFKTPYTDAATVLALGDRLKDSITALRDARTKNNLRYKEPIRVFVQTESKSAFQSIENLLAKAANAESIEYVTETVPQAITVVAGKDQFFIATEAPVDTTAQRADLEKELDYLKGFLLSVEKKLSNERFVQNAKPDVVETERRKKADAEQKIRSLEESLRAMV